MSLSILIPTHNDECYNLVEALARQAAAISGLLWEILVADDGSTDQQTIDVNQEINRMENCSYILRNKNSGRSAIRNFLAQQAQYERLLFVDADMTIVRPDYLQRYIDSSDEVIYGGYIVGNGSEQNLRYRYERAGEHLHSAQRRSLKPYRDFHTSNFLISRKLMTAHPLDERFQHYGYEDVLYGKHFQEQGIPIRHIDNPLGFCTFEDNTHFVKKTEEGICTLYQFRQELQGFSNILTATDRLRQWHLIPVCRLCYRLFAPLLRRNLCGNHPSLTVFKCYKLGYYINIL